MKDEELTFEEATAQLEAWMEENIEHLGNIMKVFPRKNIIPGIIDLLAAGNEIEDIIEGMDNFAKQKLKQEEDFEDRFNKLND